MDLAKEEPGMDPRPVHVVSPPLFQLAFTERPAPQKESYL